MTASRRHVVRSDLRHDGPGHDPHAQGPKPPLDALLLEGELAPVRDEWRGGQQSHLVAPRGEELGQQPAHDVVVVVVDDDLAGGQPPGTGLEVVEDVVGRVDVGLVVPGDGQAGRAPATVPAPRRAGGHHDVADPGREDVARGHGRGGEHLDRAEPGDLPAAPVDDPPPRRQSGQEGLARHPTAHLGPGIEQLDLVPALAQGARGLQPGGPCADHHDRRRAAPHRDALRVPAAPPLLAHGRVLGAPDRQPLGIGGHADVAADALPDRRRPAVADLRRQERVGDRGSRSPDQVEHAAAHRGDHRIRAGVATDPDDRLGRQALDERDVGLLVALRCEPGGGRVVAPVRHVDVPQVGELGEHAHDLGRLPVVGDPVGAGQLVDGQAHGHRAVVTDGVPGVLDQLAQEPHAVGQAPAVLVGPVVVPA